ncbi:Chloroperoxidase [Aspergillus karnatakaensis]|uniref:peroxidase family protein n=1 Tax=Aspergillus karnatakaensis TaxID=1810916 RepID=UPI003CCD7D79
MKLSFTVLGLAAVASASIHLNIGLGHAHNSKDPHAWRPAGLEDTRGPCPLLNTLANHNYIPRNGRDITHDDMISALTNALNLNGTLAEAMAGQALSANPDPNAETFSLEDLSQHNVVEHDASLTRGDAYFGNAVRFSPSAFAQTKKYWTGSTVTTTMLANSKIARQLDSKAFNPEYTYPESVDTASLSEIGGPILVFGDIEKGTIDRDVIENFIVNERLPTETGWTRSADAIGPEEAAKVGGMIAEAASLLTGQKPTTGSQKDKRASPHAWF